jgi:predicted nucleic acid-binding protein
LATDQLIVAPVVLLAEVAGAISRRTGRPRLANHAVDALLALPGLRLVALDSRLGTAASRLAAELGLRGTDALYVAVAHHLRLALVSWHDERRERARRVVEAHVPRVDRPAQ